jgi:pimeloyl-ACP methyl ester carboxylesterase
MHYICVHGVCHGGWCWDDIRDALSAQGHEVTTPDLPLTSLADDAAHIIKLMDDLEGPFVLVGHSYGGAVISAAAADRQDVQHLFYVAAIMIEATDNFMELAQDAPSPLSEHLLITEDNIFTIDPEHAAACLYQCCDPQEAQAAVARLRKTSVTCTSTPIGATPWRDITSTYILCHQDRAILPALQKEMATRANHIVDIDTDHSPFYSAREELIDALLSGTA